MITLRVSGLFCILSSVYRKKKVSEHLPWKVVYSETWSLKPWLLYQTVR